MRRNYVFYSALCCFLTFALNAQVKDKTKPVFQGKISSLEYVTSLASRPGDIIPMDMTQKEAKDKRSLAQIVDIGKDPNNVDDYFVKNRNPKEASRASSPPSLVFDAYASGSQPTDPSMAIGPNHVFVVFNTGFAIYDKAGVELLPETAPDPAIFPVSGCCDLTVSYDNAADRWVLSMLGGGAQIAVSDGPDPINDGWYIYTIAAINDYQKLSIWSDGYYMTDQTGSADKVWALERDAMLVGDPSAQIISFDLPGLVTSGFYSPQAFNVTNADLPATGGTPIVFMQDDAYTGVATDHLKLWTIDVDWVTTANSTISAPQEIPLTSFISVFDGGSFVNLTQPTGGTDIDALQAIIMNQAQFRKYDDHNSAVFNFVVDTDAGAGELAGIRWMELRQDDDNMPWSLYQEGTYTAPDGRHAWLGSLAMDGAGNIAMGYTSMSGPTTPTTVRVSSYYTSRLDGDPLGTMTGIEELIANGNANIPGTRYGDYNKIDVDPSDDETFWFINEYMNSGRKGVVGAFTIDDPGYCESQSSNVSLEYISRVELNTIDNVSDDQFYSDFTAISTDLQVGESYTISVTPTWPASPDTEAYAVWIDYNNDLDFEDAGELVWSAAPNSNTPNSGTFTVPVGTQVASVRMRVSMKWNDIPDPCESFTYGEVEDYTINLIDYCDSESSNNSFEYISRVELNTLDNVSGASLYSDFTAMSTDLEEGVTYAIYITPTWPVNPDTEAYAVWIDYNGDVDFDDPGELVWSAAPNMDDPHIGTFTVPFGTSLESVRMRVSLKWNDIPDPCESFTYGEVEDYKVNLVPGNPCSELDSNDGESGLGIWVDGGADATLVNDAAFANSGTHSFLLKDNTSTSTFTTGNFDLSGTDQVDFDFNYITTGFEPGHDFWLQVSTDGGATFDIEKYYFLNADFDNGVREFETISIGGPFSATTQFRFRCDAEGNSNKVYIDDIVIVACDEGFATCMDGIKNGDEAGVDCGGTSCPPCDNCNEVDSNDGESGWGLWIDSGLDAILVNNAAFANSGTYSFLIKDNTPQSFITTVDLDLTGIADVMLNFNYITAGFNNSFTQDFWLQMSTDGGATFTTIKEYDYLADFSNGVREFESVFVEGAFTSNTQFRFRCDASGNSDKVYIDDIVIEACTISTASCDDGILNQGETDIDCGGPNCEPCNGCFDNGFNDFEANLGVWNDGGADCRISPADAAFANSGAICVRLQDDTGTSNITTNNLDLSLYNIVYFDFNFIANNFSTGEGLYAEVSTDGGATFTSFNFYEVDVDFTNGTRSFPINDVFGPFTSTTQFRLRCDGSNNQDRIYIDDIFIEGCYDITGGGARGEDAIDSRIDHDAKLKAFTTDYSSKIKVYPNPTQSELTIDISEGEFEEILIYNSNGQLIHKAQNDSNKFSLDVSEYVSGMYFIKFVSENDLAVTKRFVKE